MPVNPISVLLPGIPPIESPLFSQWLDEASLSPEDARTAVDLNERGYAVIDFPDSDIEARIDRIRNSLGPTFGLFDEAAVGFAVTGDARIQDAWRTNADVHAIACNPRILELLGTLYGRRPIPFQTLNFPVGTQQHPHSDSIHFSSQPERFMCGVWLAMEDVTDEAGPLVYVPGSHKWPVLSNLAIGRRPEPDSAVSPQIPFEQTWDALIAAAGTPSSPFLARKGQALIWAANLLHGGAPRRDYALTRWSQVTHYYFGDCIYYTPAHSVEPLGQLDLRSIVNIATGELEPNRLLGETVRPAPSPKRRIWPPWRRVADRLPRESVVPDDFDPETYLQLNPDVAAGDLDARTHYARHGSHEGRRYRLG